MYLHLYYSSERALEDENTFHNRLAGWQKGLENDERHPAHEKHYRKYFDVKRTPVRGVTVTAKEAALEEAKWNYGYFALVSNDVKNAVEALEIYRSRDLAEKAFDNLKERLNLRRLAVSSEQSLDGKLFVEFIALIFLSCITRKMQNAKLFKDFTLQGVLDELDAIGCFEIPGKRIQIGEITKKQIDLYTRLNVAPPASLQFN